MDRLNTRVPPPLVMLLIAVAMAIYGWFSAASPLPLLGRILAAAALVIIAGFFAPRAFSAFRRARTTASPTRIGEVSALVTSGVFARTRNPMYVTLALFLLALASGIGQPALLLGPVVFVSYVTRFQILPEERMLESRFGEAYLAYKARVPRWLFV